VPQLKDLPDEAWIADDRPLDGLVCHPHRASNRGPPVRRGALPRCDRRWEDQGPPPLRGHVARHACARYFGAAGVPLKVRSAILGHASRRYAACSFASARTRSQFSLTLDGIGSYASINAVRKNAPPGSIPGSPAPSRTPLRRGSRRSGAVFRERVVASRSGVRLPAPHAAVASFRHGDTHCGRIALA
jgi:hypothetical protein